MSLSQNIKKLRLQKEMTQEQLASILGVSAQAVSKWETGQTYPDALLLVPIANALDASLDVLFDNEVYSMKDLSVRIQNLIANTPRDRQLHLVHEIGWQMERGLFNCWSGRTGSESSDEIRHPAKPSYILNDYGFTHVSNGHSPFFTVFPECGDRLSEVIGDGEEMRRIFQALSSPETMKAVLFLLKQEADYVFEAEVLAEVCEISGEHVDGVLADLAALRLIRKNDLEIDGQLRTLYYSLPDHRIIPLFLFAHELNYRGGYCLQAHHRKKPLLT